MVFVVKLSYTNGNQSAKNMVTALYYSKTMVDFGKDEKETLDNFFTNVMPPYLSDSG